jgi:aminoglycoside phosphotransferase (APT) family kinase protein
MAELVASPHGAFTEHSALRALTRVCQQVGLGCGSPELIRMGSNAVFRIDSDVIARVAPYASCRSNADKQIEVARWLAAIDYPAVRALGVRQPIEADGRVVTFWESVAEETVYAPIADVAALIKRLHSLTPPPTLPLPPLQPFGSDSDPLPDFPGLAPEDARYLRGRVEWARSSFPRLPFVLPLGVIHGDANVGNVLMRSDGNAVLIDLDSFSMGPREWDLAQTALFFDRLGWHTEDEYRTFVDVYGYDLMQWAGYADLADIREIAMTSWLSKKAGNSPEAAVEAAKRVEAIRSGGSRRDWGAY